jgi:hypothetical protein
VALVVVTPNALSDLERLRSFLVLAIRHQREAGYV